VWFPKIGAILHEEFEQHGWRFDPNELALCRMKLSSIYNADARQLVPRWGKEVKFDNSKSKSVLGIEYEKDLKPMLIAMAYTMLENNCMIDKRPKPKKDKKKRYVE